MSMTQTTKAAESAVPAGTSPLVCYIPSFNNSEEVLDSVATTGNLPCVVVDNASDALHRERLRGSLPERASLIQHETNLGRVGNWNFCVEHFAQSGTPWMKWLFAGDALLPGAGERCLQGAAEHPTARLIIAAYTVVDGEQRTPVRPIERTQLMTPLDSVAKTVQAGSWYGAPTGHCIHRDAVVAGFEFGHLPYVADAWFCLHVAAKFPVLYLAEEVGEFHATKRAYFRRQSRSASAVLEQGLLRVRAAELLEELQPGSRGASDAAIEQWLQRAVIDRSPVSQAAWLVARGAIHQSRWGAKCWRVAQRLRTTLLGK
jgi:hypothetical protein